MLYMTFLVKEGSLKKEIMSEEICKIKKIHFEKVGV